MKEIRTLILVLFCVGILYWFVEPYAHTKLHPHVSPANYDFAAGDIALAAHNVEAAKLALQSAEKEGDATMIKNAQKAIDEAKSQQDKVILFWNEVDKIDLGKGDAVRGAETFTGAGCTACHGVEVASIPAPMDAQAASQAFGANPPDLSSAGYIYTDKFLAAFIKDPVMAVKLNHKFNDEAPYPMPPFVSASGEANQDIADIVAYLKSIAPSEDKLIDAKVAAAGIKADENLTQAQREFFLNKAVFEDACVRCHDVKYDKLLTQGDKASVANYMGSTPPDLSMSIRSKKAGYLHEFINDTQKILPGTSMPRVGLNERAETQVVAYLQSVGDSKKSQREATTINIMIYFLILSVFAGLWKSKIWSKLH
nr:c-type cytochrome [uncultured Campylobacter sp.]